LCNKCSPKAFNEAFNGFFSSLLGKIRAGGFRQAATKTHLAAWRD
jgi:hypothetical protein